MGYGKSRGSQGLRSAPGLTEIPYLITLGKTDHSKRTAKQQNCKQTFHSYFLTASNFRLRVIPPIPYPMKKSRSLTK
jgi:hypothetical protein